MDSGNSGSMQSSSGGEEEYDSGRTEAVSAFLNPSAAVDPLPLFESISSYFDGFPRSPPPPPSEMSDNPYRNLDASGWARKPQPDGPNCTGVASAVHQSPPPSSLQEPNLSTTCYMNPNCPCPPVPDPQPGAAGPGRSSRKRSRASRRAATTVLTTNTANFRAMVQEFTGVPSAPFSPYPRTRLDLFGASSALRSAISDPLPPPSPPPSYLAPASGQINSSFMSFPLSSSPPLPFSSSTSSSSAVGSSTSASNSLIMSANASTGSGYLNTQNPMFTFQSLLQAPPDPLPPKSTSSGFLSGLGGRNLGVMEDGPADHSQVKIGNLDAFSLNGHGAPPSSFISSEGMFSRGAVHYHHNSSWGVAGEGEEGSGGSSRHFSDGNHSGSSRRDGEKAAESAAAASRGEVMMESWICSSD